VSRPSEWTLCILCRISLGRGDHRFSLCNWCEERLNVETDHGMDVACPHCGRHQELCLALPCAAASLSDSPRLRSVVPAR
jgi:hypothetical protein